MRYATLLVDEETSARQHLRTLLDASSDFEVIGEVDNGMDACRCIEDDTPDLILSDIRLPDLDAFKLLTLILRQDYQPNIAFVTRDEQLALKAFEFGIIDYLLKPVNAQDIMRLAMRLKRLKMPRTMDAVPPSAEQAVTTPDYLARIAVRLGKRIFLINLSDVTHFVAKDKYVFMYTHDAKEYIVDYSIADLEHRLNPKQFVRIHRSTITNVAFIHEIHTWLGGKYRLILSDQSHSELIMSRSMAINLKTLVPF